MVVEVALLSAGGFTIATGVVEAALSPLAGELSGSVGNVVDAVLLVELVLLPEGVVDATVLFKP